VTCRFLFKASVVTCGCWCAREWLWDDCASGWL